MKRGIYLAVLVAVAATAPSWAGDGVVALQTADPSCPDDSGDRYVNCGNGTVTDNNTGLVWLADADCIGAPTKKPSHYDAMAAVAGLSDLPYPSACGFLNSHQCDCGLTDGSSPGDWRLPSIGEWEAMLEAACDPAITNDAGDGCWSQLCSDLGNCSFFYVRSSFYWSSSSSLPSPTLAWVADLIHGEGGEVYPKNTSLLVWPVRGGQ